jgi:hypothetical protein
MMLNNLTLFCCKPRTLLLILFFLITTVTSYTHYEGCFPDSPSRVLNDFSTKNSNLTTETCIQICLTEDFAYAGVEYGTQCFCGNVLPTTPIDEKFCNVSCAGDTGESCGGIWAIGVYNTRNYTSHTRPKIAVKAIVGITLGATTALCIIVYLASRKWNTPHTYPDDMTLYDIYKTSKTMWSIIVLSLVFSSTIVIAAARANIVVLQVHNLGSFEKIKGSVIAIVGTILHVLIGNVVMGRCASAVVWILMIYPGQVRFSLLYNTMVGIGFKRITYCLRNKEHLMLLIWITLGTGSIISSLITGVIFKDTVCTDATSVTAPVASYWRQIAGGGNNSVIPGSYAAIMATGSIANKLDSPGIIYDRNSSGMVALRPLQYPDTFRNTSNVKALEAVLTTTSCQLDVTRNATVIYTDQFGDQTLQVRYYDQSFNLTIDNGGPERFKWLYLNTSLSSGKIHHATTMTLSVINDQDYPRYILDPELQGDLGVELIVDIPPNSIFNISVHLVVSACEVVSYPINVTMTGDLLTVVEITQGNGVDNWWSLVNTTDVGLGLVLSYVNMRARSAAASSAPGLLEAISLNYSFTGTPCIGPLECVEQLHSKTFSSILQNTAIPLVYDPQTYQTETQKICPISIDISVLLLTFGTMGLCFSTMMLAEHGIMHIRKTCRPTKSVLELCKRASELVGRTTDGLCAADEMALLETIGHENISANFKTTNSPDTIHFSFDISNRSIASSDLTRDKYVRGRASRRAA